LGEVEVEVLADDVLLVTHQQGHEQPHAGDS
jgi:hypothetical protein